jgi:toxin ParE1/3/4
VNKILNSTQNLGAFPYIGRMVPEISNENIRERFVYSYRLIYKIEEIEILIVAVIHGKRLLENIPNRFN